MRRPTRAAPDARPGREPTAIEPTAIETTALAVADTHALLWHAGGKPQKLGRHARAHFERADRREAAVYVPTVVLAEVGELVQRGTVRLPRPFAEWMDDLLGSGVYLAADLTADIVRRAHDLFAIPERGDRLIAATAAALDLPLMTRDPEIAACAAVARLWD